MRFQTVTRLETSQTSRAGHLRGIIIDVDLKRRTISLFTRIVFELFQHGSGAHRHANSSQLHHTIRVARGRACDLGHELHVRRVYGLNPTLLVARLRESTRRRRD